MTTWAALDALSHQLELCGVGPTTSVVAITSSPDDELPRLLHMALARSQADAIEVRAIRDGGSLLASACRSADLVIDASDDAWFLDHDTPSDARVLRLDPHAADAHLWPPHANLAHRVEHADAALAGAETLRVTDGHGTDVGVDLGEARLDFDHGRVRREGEHGTFPSGWCMVEPAAHRVAGSLVLMPGDANLGRHGHIDAPLRLEISDDRIVSIEGDHSAADTIRAQFDDVGHPDAYAFAGISLGLNPGRVPPLELFDPSILDTTLAQLRAGLVTIWFGENLHADRPAPRRLGFVLRRRTIEVDGLLWCRDGRLVGEVAPDVYELPG